MIRFPSSNATAGAVVAAAIVYGWYARSFNLGPASLWLDDVWVAVLSRAPSLSDFLSHGSSSPPLFNALVALCLWLLPGRELPAQLFPFICAILAIPATAFASYRLSGRAWAGAVAAVIVACHPAAIEYAARVKQYSSDMLVVAAHVAAFCFLLDRPSVRALWIYTVAAGAAMLLSTVSLFVVVAFFPFAMAALGRRGVPLRHVATATIAMLATVVVVYVSVLRPGINDALREFWAPHYLPTDSAAAFLKAVYVVMADWLAHALHGFAAEQREPWVVAAGAAIVALGAFSLVRTSERRSCVLASFVLLLGVFFASATRRFPLGTGRVDLFLVPMIAVFVGAGFAFVGQTKHASLRILWVTAAAVFALLKFPAPRRPAYPVQFSSPLIAMIAQEKTAEDVLLVNVHGTFALGYYSPWQPRFVADATLGTGFHVVPQTTGIVVIGEQPDDPQKSVTRAASTHPPRIFFLTVHALPSLRPKVEEQLTAAGWKLTRREQSPGAELSVFASVAGR